MTDYGDWNMLVRELSGYDIDRAKQIIRWPLRDALLARVHQMQQFAIEEYRHQYLIWAMLAPHSKKSKPPKLPAILRG